MLQVYGPAQPCGSASPPDVNVSRRCDFVSYPGRMHIAWTDAHRLDVGLEDRQGGDGPHAGFVGTGRHRITPNFVDSPGGEAMEDLTGGVAPAPEVQRVQRASTVRRSVAGSRSLASQARSRPASVCCSEGGPGRTRTRRSRHRRREGPSPSIVGLRRRRRSEGLRGATRAAPVADGVERRRDVGHERRDTIRRVQHRMPDMDGARRSEQGGRLAGRAGHRGLVLDLGDPGRCDTEELGDVTNREAGRS